MRATRIAIVTSCMAGRGEARTRVRRATVGVRSGMGARMQNSLPGMLQGWKFVKSFKFPHSLAPASATHSCPHQRAQASPYVTIAVLVALALPRPVRPRPHPGLVDSVPPFLHAPSPPHLVLALVMTSRQRQQRGNCHVVITVLVVTCDLPCASGDGHDDRRVVPRCNLFVQP